jgi:hypothetical protein
VPAGHADAPGDDHADDTPEPPLRDRPILLVDIDRLLEGSADVEHLDHEALRTWRADLTLVLESLIYARDILAADVAILRHASAADVPDGQSVVDDLPDVLLNPDPQGGRSSEPGDEQGDAELSEDLFRRTDQLLSAHQEMAVVDLSSPFDVAGSLAVIDEQLTALTERQEAVGARLQQIRAAIIRRYEEGEASARDQPA